MKRTGESGVVMVEYALMIPFLLFLTFGILQLAMIFVADAVMEYAAYSAARAELVSNINNHGEEELNTDPQTAASLVCSLISFGQATGEPSLHLPGFGTLPGSGYAFENTSVVINDVDDFTFEAVVSFNYELLFPELALPFLSISPVEYDNRNEDGRLVLEKTCTMTRNF
jgi:Flp pilus assembly protein TadG